MNPLNKHSPSNQNDLSSRCANFSSGPAYLPDAVNQRLKSLIETRLITGHSVLEDSHRSQSFTQIHLQIETLIRRILNVPKHYIILLLPGGARTQSAAIPMNFIHTGTQPIYIETGIWSTLASREAIRYGDILRKTKNDELNTQHFKDCAYYHYVDNETIDGFYWSELPTLQHRRVVCDMTSSLFAYPPQFDQVGLIYAASQKNFGLPGMTLVMVDSNWLSEAQPLSITPSVLNYPLQYQSNSLVNTPANITWITGLFMLEWMESQGGLEKLIEQTELKSNTLYQFLDESDFYQARVQGKGRSKVNIIFETPSTQLDQSCVDFLESHGVIGIKGHRLVGGLRASCYIACPFHHIQHLIKLLQAFEGQYG